MRYISETIREKVYFAIAFRLSTPHLSKRLQTRLSSWQPKFFSRHIILMPQWTWLGIDSINIGNVTTILSSVRRSRDVTTTAGPVDVDVLALRVGLAGELRLDAEGVGTEVVTLGLQDVGREVLGAGLGGTLCPDSERLLCLLKPPSVKDAPSNL